MNVSIAEKSSQTNSAPLHPGAPVSPVLQDGSFGLLELSLSCSQQASVPLLLLS